MKKIGPFSALTLLGSFAIAMLLSMTAVAQQRECRTLFVGEDLLKFETSMATFGKESRAARNAVEAIPSHRIVRSIGGIPRTITFVAPENFVRYQATTERIAQIEMLHSKGSHATLSNKAADLARRGLFALIPRVLKGDFWRQAIEPKVIEFKAPEKLDSKTILAFEKDIARALYETAKTTDTFGEASADSFKVRIGHETLSGSDFLALADQARTQEFVRVNMGENLNSTMAGRTANVLTSLARLWGPSLATFAIGFYGVGSVADGANIPYVTAASAYGLVGGIATAAGSVALSVVGSVGNLFSQKLAFLFPNVTGTVGFSEHRALKLHAAANGAKTLIKLTSENPNATEILVVTGSSDLREEFQKRIEAASDK